MRNAPVSSEGVSESPQPRGLGGKPPMDSPDDTPEAHRKSIGGLPIERGTPMPMEGVAGWGLCHRVCLPGRAVHETAQRCMSARPLGLACWTREMHAPLGRCVYVSYSLLPALCLSMGIQHKARAGGVVALGPHLGARPSRSKT